MFDLNNKYPIINPKTINTIYITIKAIKVIVLASIVKYMRTKVFNFIVLILVYNFINTFVFANNSKFAEIYISKDGSLAVRNYQSSGDVSVIASGEVNTRYAVGTYINNLNQWQSERLEYEEVHKIATGKGITVAVIDSGVDSSHPDLQGQVLKGIDLIDRELDGNYDPNGHGTHIAGIIAGKKNDFGVTGLSYNAKILPIRVLDQFGEGNDADIAFGILWAEQNGADIINLSLGGTKEDPLLRDAIAEVVKKGVIVVAASGNTGDSKDIFYPAANPMVIATASTDLLDKTSFFSTRGDYVDIAAPGSMIRSTTIDNSYKVDSGTSMATPIISATFALLLEKGLSVNESIERLYNTAYDIEEVGKDKLTGYGLVDPLQALTSNVPRVKNWIRENNKFDKVNDKFMIDLIEKNPIIVENNKNDSAYNKNFSKLISYISLTDKKKIKEINLYTKNYKLAYRKIKVVLSDNKKNKYIYNLRTNSVGLAKINVGKEIKNIEISYIGDNLTNGANLKQNILH
jgi:type VII secretion-associated serine protease mycosin